MNKEEFIGKLQMVYVGDRNAFNEIVEDNQKLKNEVVYSKVEIDKLNNIINKIKQQLLNKKDIVEKSKYFKLVYYIDWNMKHEWDKTIVEKIDEIINIIEEANK